MKFPGTPLCRRCLAGLDQRFPLPAVSFFIKLAALLASSSVSNPITDEYLLPITCVTKKPRLIPASAIASATAFPNPCLLSPSTSKVGIVEALSPAEVAALTVFLPETG
jgi:hypothetical protein